MSFLASLPTQAIIEAIGWSLVHFVWQGAVVAAMFAAVIALLRNARSNLRYFVGCIALAAMTVWPVATLTWSLIELQSNAIGRADRSFPAAESGTIERPVYRENDSPKDAQANKHVIAQQPVSNDKNSVARLMEFLSPALPWLVAAWSVGVVVLGCRLCVGWISLQSLRRRTTSVPEEWRSTLSRLGASIGVARSVQLLESALVEVPTLLGWVRPVILLPASALIGLEPRQLEALLAHELAHIRRHDYLVNLIQTAIETVLFYHPAVWWVSSTIRATREECCDDIAAAVCGNRVEYARSLATMEQLRSHAVNRTSSLAVAADGGRLIDRIRRLTNAPPPRSNRSAWWLLAAGGLAIAALLTFQSTTARQVQAAAVGDPTKSTIDDWGRENDGLRVRLTLLTEKPSIGQPIRLRLEVKNTGDTVRQIDEQIAAPFRILEARSADGQKIEYVGPSYQTAGSPKAIQPNETLVLWDNVDVADMFLLVEAGKYSFKTKFAGYGFSALPGKEARVSDLGVSNVVSLDVAAGALSEHKATLNRLRAIAPQGWRVSTGNGGIYFTHNPTGLKADSTTIQIWFTKERLPADFKLGEGRDRQMVDYLGHTSIGHANIAAPRVVKKLWPNYVEIIRERLLHDAPAEVLKDEPGMQQQARRSEGSPANVKRSASIRVRVLDQSGNQTDAVYLNLWRKISSNDAVAGERWSDGKATWERTRNWCPQYPIPTAGLGFSDIAFGEYRITAARHTSMNELDPSPFCISDVINLNAASVFHWSTLVVMQLVGERVVRVAVVDGSTRQPIKNAAIRLSLKDGPPIVGARSGTGNFFDRTNDQGMLVYSHMPAGPYELRVQPIAATLSNPVEYKLNKLVTLTNLKLLDAVNSDRETRFFAELEGRRLSEKELDERWPHSVYGRVTDANGRPMADVEVHANTGVGTLLGHNSTVTDAEGRYRLRFDKGIWMSKGSNSLQCAIITARKPGFFEKNQSRQGDLMMADEAPTAKQAPANKVILPHQPRQIDFVMLPAGKVRGVVLDGNGQPLDGVRVSLTGKVLPPASSVLEQTHTDKGGRFEMNDIPSGFKFQFLIEPAKAAPPWQAWASAPMEFLDPGTKAIHAKSGDSNGEVSAKPFEIQLLGFGIPWRQALDRAATESGKGELHDRPKPTTDTWRLKLGKDSDGGSIK